MDSRQIRLRIIGTCQRTHMCSIADILPMMASQDCVCDACARPHCTVMRFINNSDTVFNAPHTYMVPIYVCSDACEDIIVNVHAVCNTWLQFVVTNEVEAMIANYIQNQV